MLKTTLLVVIIILLAFIFYYCKKLDNPYDEKYDIEKAAPKNFKIESINGTTVKLTWEKQTNYSVKYIIDRKLENNEWVSNYSIIENKTEFTDNYADGLKIYYRIYLKAGKRETKKQETYFGLPVLTTKPITDITYITSTCGGNIGDDGHLPITLKGVCWGISQNPTLNDFKTNDGNGTGSYVSNLTGLISNTTYYVRAFATNTIGTGYGDQISFTTLIIPPTTIWSSDFSNTYDWSFSYFTGFNSGAYWIITTNNPQGARSSQMGRINSTTWSNKFALFDSNYMGANLNQNNQYSCIQTENSINCTQYSHITIEFQQYYKKY